MTSTAPASPRPAPSTPLTVGQVEELLRQVAPNDLAESWDSNRLICGDPAEPVSSVLLAVDPVAAVVDEALERGVQMLITHHPLYLRGTDQVSAADPKGRLVHRLIRAGVALANAHTSLDSAHGGVADALARAVGLTGARVLSPSTADPQQGIGRVADLEEPTTLRELAQKAAAALPDSAPGLLVGGDLDAQVTRVAVSGGSGDSLLGLARQAGADVFLTADLRHHPASEHLEAGRPFLLCGTHWATEWVGLPPLARRLEELASKQGHRLSVTVSQAVTDPWAVRLPTGPRG
ncbi:Nif3-like dinuclear metal center hexameric protein [Actinomyces weissii]|uniref:GTP cyclohydrolase 1 type 2 homolog n=1 Tax=Actinomyces weissii TaxID=675090 RepID=A0A7T7MAV3_9ACTO|nr:Nif3-like dinuclear metal center hexameric protein [Actinomyces weissii]QQM68121.1 Nif3-like dinuclear metal center hexameric protein [Actinomyces weissii]